MAKLPKHAAGNPAATDAGHIEARRTGRLPSTSASAAVISRSVAPIPYRAEPRRGVAGGCSRRSSASVDPERLAEPGRARLRRFARASSTLTRHMRPGHYRAIELASLRAGRFGLAQPTSSICRSWRDPAPARVAWSRNAWCGGQRHLRHPDRAQRRRSYVHLEPAGAHRRRGGRHGHREAVSLDVGELRGRATRWRRSVSAAATAKRNVGPADRLRCRMPSQPRATGSALASTGVSALAGARSRRRRCACRPGGGRFGGRRGPGSPASSRLARQRGCRVDRASAAAIEKKRLRARSLGAERVIDYRDRVGRRRACGTEYRDRHRRCHRHRFGRRSSMPCSTNLAPRRPARRRRCGAGPRRPPGNRRPAPRVVHKLYFKAASVRGFMNGLPHRALWPEARRETCSPSTTAGRPDHHLV